MAGQRIRRVGRELVKYLLGVVIISTLAWPAFLAAPEALAGTWSSTGSMNDRRTWFSATQLHDGKVLAAAGYDWATKTDMSSAEIYDPVMGIWNPTGDMGATRYCHEAVLLANGQVLVVGGYINHGYDATFPEQLFDPATGTWISTGAPVSRRYAGHAVTVLADGRVLAAGGVAEPNIQCVNSAEIYNPATGTWSSATPMNADRWHFTATLLANGQVLVAGGLDGTYSPVARAELYDPVHNSWTPTGLLHDGRYHHAATLLPDGRVLISGGRTYSGPLVTSAEIYDPASGNFSTTSALNSSRNDHTATLLDNGKVLAAGGYSFQASCELFNPAAWNWNVTGPFASDRSNHRAVRLRDGKVLAAGGDWVEPNYYSLSTAELYTPDPPAQVNLPGLVAFYPFDGNTQDASGNGNYGMVTGAPQVVTGYQGQAYQFNGTTDYITTPVDINPNKLPRLTMGAWIKLNSAWPAQQLLTHDNGDFDRSLGIDFRGAGGVGWSAFCGPTSQVLGAMQGYLNLWTFVAVSYDQSAQTVKLWVDNQVLTKSGVTLGSGLKQLFIGASPAFNVFFCGTIDNAFIFADALTDQQMAYIRSQGAPAILSAPRWHPRMAPVPVIELLLN